MKKFIQGSLFVFSCICCIQATAFSRNDDCIIYSSKLRNPRVEYGISKLQAALQAVNIKASIVHTRPGMAANIVVVGFLGDTLIQSLIKELNFKLHTLPGKEGFIIRTANNVTLIAGTDASGIMYGCFELADSIHSTRKIPALLPLQESVRWYKTLTTLTDKAYRYANSMQTAQRKIPFRGVDATFIKWNEVLPQFEKELAVFTHKLDSLKNPVASGSNKSQPLQPVQVRIKNNISGRYNVVQQAKPFKNLPVTITDVAPELAKLQGIITDTTFQNNNETVIRFQNDQPVKLLVGYLVSTDRSFLKEPELETNANANNRGEADVAIANALVIENMPAVNVHSYLFNAGDNALVLPKGKVLLLGFIPANELLKPFDAGLTPAGTLKNVDWLFEQ